MSTTPQAGRRAWDLSTAFVFLAVLIGAAILVAVIDEEPYDVAELDQVRTYDQALGDVVDASFTQDQPPLDPVLNTLVYRTIGLGDARQRLLSVVAGIGSLVIFGTLAWRAGLGVGAAAAVLVLAVSPLLVSVTVYVRPYALALLLMLAFVLLADRWLASANRWLVPALFLVALLLPLSRAVEPVVFLGAVVGVLAVGWWIRRDEPWPGSPLAPIGAAAAGLVAVALPVLWRLSPEADPATVADRFSRLWNELPEVVAEVNLLWPLAGAVVLVWLALPRARGALLSSWWFWVLVVVPVGSTVGVLLTTPRPYDPRDLFSWVPAFALIVGAVTWAILEQARSGERIVPALTGTLLIVTVAAAAVHLADDLAGNEVPDWETASYLLVDETPIGTVVVFDAVGPFGADRSPFAGQPRYTGTGQSIPTSVDIIEDPGLVPDDAPIEIMLLGARPDIDGWTALPADDRFTLYLPEEPTVGRVAAAEAMLVFAEALGPNDGATLTLAAVALLEAAGEADAAAAASVRPGL